MNRASSFRRTSVADAGPGWSNSFTLTGCLEYDTTYGVMSVHVVVADVGSLFQSNVTSIFGDVDPLTFRNATGLEGLDGLGELRRPAALQLDCELPRQHSGEVGVGGSVHDDRADVDRRSHPAFVQGDDRFGAALADHRERRAGDDAALRELRNLPDPEPAPAAEPDVVAENAEPD